LENKNKANTTQIDSFVDENGKEFFQIADDSSETDSYTIGIEINTSVSEAMNSLKPQYRKVAELRFIECRDYAEIAEIMSISMDNVKVSVKRCKEMLQNKLQSTYAFLKA
jgi:RNA polymerase sigma factor (sigma-70 family)